MSRCDQYIGLTEQGEKFFDQLSNKKLVSIAHQAFNPDPLMGWESKSHGVVYREAVQAAPWSSGPMYFTYIQVIKNGKIVDKRFMWKEDPKLLETHQEYDKHTGTFYV